MSHLIHQQQASTRADQYVPTHPCGVVLGRPLVVGLLRLLRQLLLHLRAPPEEDVVDKGVLQQGKEDHDEAAHQVHINGLDVWDLGQGLSQVGVDGRHCQHRGDAFRQEQETFSQKTESVRIENQLRLKKKIYSWILGYLLYEGTIKSQCSGLGVFNFYQYPDIVQLFNL